MSDIVTEAARGWIGTPFVLGAALRGVGCDCLGLIRGLSADLGNPLPSPHAYPPGWAAPGAPEVLAQGLARHLPPVAGHLVPGQVALFRLRPGAAAVHLGVITRGGDTPRFVHAYDRHGTIESPLAPAWARRIVARFDLI